MFAGQVSSDDNVNPGPKIVTTANTIGILGIYPEAQTYNSIHRFLIQPWHICTKVTLLSGLTTWHCYWPFHLYIVFGWSPPPANGTPGRPSWQVYYQQGRHISENADIAIKDPPRSVWASCVCICLVTAGEESLLAESAVLTITLIINMPLLLRTYHWVSGTEFHLSGV